MLKEMSSWRTPDRRKHKDSVIKNLKDLFGSVLHIDVIRSVASECDFDVQKSSNALLEMTNHVDEPRRKQLKKKSPTQQQQRSQPNLCKPKKTLELERIVANIRQGFKVLVIVRGPPGSGKSRLAAAIADVSLGPGNNSNHILSTDDFFMQTGSYVYEQCKIPEAHEWNQKRAFYAMSKGLSPVIIDNTNTQMWEMKPYAVMATDYGYIVEIVEPDNWWLFNDKELAKRNVHNVPRNKIQDMLDRYEKNVTPQKLLGAYNLSYKFQKPPQFRLIPPIVKHINRSKSTSQILETNLMDFCEVDSQTTAPSQQKDMDPIDEILMCKEENQVEVLQPVKHAFPDLENAWGIDEKALQSWDIVEPIDCLTKPEVPPEQSEEITIETKESGTCMEANDLNESKVIQAQNRDINLGLPLKLPSPRKKTMIDQSSLTEDLDEDEEKCIKDLVDLFPKVPRSYLQELYYKCDKNFTWTVDLLVDGNLDAINLEEKKTLEPQASTSAVESDSDDDDDPKNMIELNLGETFVSQLESMFGAGDKFPQGYQPVVQIPVTLARQIYSFYIESVCQQMETQNHILEKLLKEDEEFARKLQMQEEAVLPTRELNLIMDEQVAINMQREAEEEWKNMTADDLASKLTKQKLFNAFPKLDRDVILEIWHADSYDYFKTVETLMMSVGVEGMNGSIENVKEAPVPNFVLEEMKEAEEQCAVDEQDNEAKAAAHYREEAGKHLKKRAELYEKARSYYQRGMPEVALFYSGLAKKETNLFDQANHLAAAAYSEEHSKRLQKFDTLDLHYLYVKEAIPSLDLFIDRNINLLKGGTKRGQDLFVITGRGKNSEGGRSKIKPAVIARLKKRNIGYVQLNPGLLKIRVQCNSQITSDVP